MPANRPKNFGVNPRKSWYRNLDSVTVNGDDEVTFHLKRPQPSFIALLASGWSPVYPCHVSPRDMRSHPIGTGPFKFVEFKPNESVKVARNPDYWKKGRPYLDAIEYTLMPNPATAILAFSAGKFDRAWQGIMSIPLMKQLKDQNPNAECVVVPWNIPRQMLVNRGKPPFDNAELRRAMTLSLDRQAFIDILGDGQGSVGGAMMPPPAGSWGMPPEVLHTLPGYGADVQKNRAEAREIMKKLGYGPDKRLAASVTTRNTPAYRDPAVLLIDQLKEIYIDGTLNAIDTTQWYPTVMRKDYAVGLTVSENGLDDPDQQFYENFACGAERNYTGYCNAEVDQLIDKQSSEPDVGKRKEIVWEIERKLAEDAARPALFLSGVGGLLAALFQGAYDDGQRQLQWLAVRGRLARQISALSGPERRSKGNGNAWDRSARGGGHVGCGFVGRHRAGAKIGRHFPDATFRQPGQHVDPRGIDAGYRTADDGGVQQPRAVRPARRAEQPAIRSFPIWRPNGNGARTARN